MILILTMLASLYFFVFSHFHIFRCNFYFPALFHILHCSSYNTEVAGLHADKHCSYLRQSSVSWSQGPPSWCSNVDGFSAVHHQTRVQDVSHTDCMKLRLGTFLTFTHNARTTLDIRLVTAKLLKLQIKNAKHKLAHRLWVIILY